MKIALIQMKVGMDKDKNLEKARRMVLQAGREGARIAVLPEMFCCPYANEYFPKFVDSGGDPIDMGRFASAIMPEINRRMGREVMHKERGI